MQLKSFECLLWNGRNGESKSQVNSRFPKGKAKLPGKSFRPFRPFHKAQKTLGFSMSNDPTPEQIAAACVAGWHAGKAGKIF